MKTIYKSKAKVLRHKGYSLGEISRRFGISKSTASLWTKNVAISAPGMERIELQRNLGRTKGHATLHERKLVRLEEAEKEATMHMKEIVKNKFLSITIIAILYQCEGSKTGSSIRFTNSDPHIIRLFLATFREVFTLSEEKLRARIHLHDYHDEVQMIDFWSKNTSIPKKQFYKSFMKKSNHIYKKEGYKGCLHISYNNAHNARVLASFAKKLSSLYI
jgi:hypothetical protein